MAKKSTIDTNPQYYPVDYSSAKSPDEAWKIYENAVRSSVDPHYTYQGSVWNPVGGQSHEGQVAKLANMLKQSPFGQKQRTNFIEKHIANYDQGGGLRNFPTQKKKLNQKYTNQINQNLYLGGQQGVSQDDLVAALYQRLKEGKKPNLAKEIVNTPEGQKRLYENSPQYHFQQYVNQSVLPIIQDRASKLHDAADILEAYQGTNTKGKAALLANLGYTSAADIYRGLTDYLAKDEPVTPQTLRNAATNIQSPMGLSNYEIQDQLKQAADRGKLINLMNQLVAMTGAKGVDPTTASPETLWQLVNAGGATGIKKSSTSGTPQGAIDPSTGKPVK